MTPITELKQSNTLETIKILNMKTIKPLIIILLLCIIPYGVILLRGNIIKSKSNQMITYLTNAGYKDVKFIDTNNWTLTNEFSASNATENINVTIVNSGVFEERPFLKSKLK